MFIAAEGYIRAMLLPFLEIAALIPKFEAVLLLPIIMSQMKAEKV